MRLPKYEAVLGTIYVIMYIIIWVYGIYAISEGLKAL